MLARVFLVKTAAAVAGSVLFNFTTTVRQSGKDSRYICP